MPALAGEPWRGLAVVYIENDVFANDNWRRFSVSIDDVDLTVDAPADQATWEGLPGGSLTLRVEWATEGAPLAGAPGSGDITVQVRFPGGAQVGGSWVTGDGTANGSTTRTFHFDDDPLSQVLGAFRAGTLELYLSVQRTAAVAWGPADSRGAYATPVAATHNDSGRGYVRARCAIVNDPVPSNVVIGGAEPALFAFPDPIHTRVVLDAVKYRAHALELEMLRTGTSIIERESTLAAQTATDHDFSWTGTGGSNRRIGNGMFLGSEAKDFRVKMAALDFGGDNEYVFAAAGHAAGWARDSDLQLTNAAELTADPRVRFPDLFQIEDNTFGTPPSSKHVASRKRLTTQRAFLTERAINARNEGQNGMTLDRSLQDLSAAPEPPITSNGVATGTQGGEAGWAGVFLPWSSQLPGGAWRKTVMIVTPSDATGLEQDNLTDYTLLATNPSISVRAYINVIANPDRHWIAGDEVRINAYLLDTSTSIRIDPDVGTFRIGLVRFNSVALRLEQLIDDIDDTPAAWQTWEPGDPLTFFDLSPVPADARLFIRDFAATGGWTRDVTATFLAEVDGTPYAGPVDREITGAENLHDTVDDHSTLTGVTPDQHHAQDHAHPDAPAIIGEVTR